MATSGTSTFNATRNQIVDAAAELVGAKRPGQTLGDGVASSFQFALNAMVKRWQAKGLHVWTVSEATLWPVIGQEEYTLGPASTDHCSTEYIKTTLTADLAAGVTALGVDSIADIAAGDHLGIQLDDGTLQWTTVDGAPAGSTVTAAAALTDSASEGNAVFAYTSNVVRPIKVPEGGARLFDSETEDETPINVVARLDYRSLTKKTVQGTVSQLFYDPQLSNGKMFLWQSPDSELKLVRFTFWRPIEDFTVAGDNPDLPQEWIDTLIFNLAVVRAPVYSMPLEKFTQIKTMAAEFLDDVSGGDREGESVHFGVDMDQ